MFGFSWMFKISIHNKVVVFLHPLPNLSCHSTLWQLYMLMLGLVSSFLVFLPSTLCPCSFLLLPPNSKPWRTTWRTWWRGTVNWRTRWPSWSRSVSRLRYATCFCVFVCSVVRRVRKLQNYFDFQLISTWSASGFLTMEISAGWKSGRDYCGTPAG